MLFASQLTACVSIAPSVPGCTTSHGPETAPSKPSWEKASADLLSHLSLQPCKPEAQVKPVARRRAKIISSGQEGNWSRVSLGLSRLSKNKLGQKRNTSTFQQSKAGPAMCRENTTLAANVQVRLGSPGRRHVTPSQTGFERLTVHSRGDPQTKTPLILADCSGPKSARIGR